ncbi:MAG: heme NO-binding domain-containing protein [Nitrospirales bacterium]|nr:heme NO-binding domain-containing protein [Nitrospirales bacterium]
MKGIVFTEFLEMVENQFGNDTVDDIIESAHLPSGGAYTAVGTYNHEEIVSLVSQLSSVSSIAVPTLVKTFGQYLFGRFFSRYPDFFKDVANTFDFLQSVEGHIHVEVKKLYPDAELPSFHCRKLPPNQFEMIYQSTRHFGDLAEGLILACIQHYGEAITLNRENLEVESGQTVRFILTKA